MGKHITYDQLLEMTDQHLRALEENIMNYDGPTKQYIEEYNTFMQFRKNLIENAKHFIEAEGTSFQRN